MKTWGVIQRSISCRWRTRATQACCKQRWTLSVINLRPSWVDNACMRRLMFSSNTDYLSKAANCNPRHLHLAPLLGWWTPFEFCRDLRHQKTIDSLDCGVVSMTLRLAVSRQHRLVTDRQTDSHTTTAYTAQVRRRAVIKLNVIIINISQRSPHTMTRK